MESSQKITILRAEKTSNWDDAPIATKSFSTKRSKKHSKPAGDYWASTAPTYTWYSPFESTAESLSDVVRIVQKVGVREIVCPGLYRYNPAWAPREDGAVIRGQGKTLFDADRNWLAVDVDSWRPDELGILSTLDAIGEAVALWRSTDAPEAFRGAELYWHASGSAGIKAGLRVHLYAWLARPACLGSLAKWASELPSIPGKPKSDKVCKIDTQLYQVSRVIYEADPVFERGAVDPFPDGRWGHLPGGEIDLPGIVDLVTFEDEKAKRVAKKTADDAEREKAKKASKARGAHVGDGFYSYDDDDDDTDLVIDALTHLMPTHHDDWVAVGMALKSGEAKGKVRDAFGIWQKWSAKSDYGPKNDHTNLVKNWNGFDAGGERKIGTLFGMAADNGWSNPRKGRTKQRNSTAAERFATALPETRTPEPPPIFYRVDDADCVDIEEGQKIVRAAVADAILNQGRTKYRAERRYANRLHREAVQLLDVAREEGADNILELDAKRAELLGQKRAIQQPTTSAPILITAPPGIGKTTAILDAAEEVQLTREDASIVLSVHNDAQRKTTEHKLHQRGVKVHRIATRKAANCEMFAEYLDAGRRSPTGGSSYCRNCPKRDTCPLIPQLGPRPATVSVVTHAWLEQVGPESLDADVFIIDERLELDPVGYSAAMLNAIIEARVDHDQRLNHDATRAEAYEFHRWLQQIATESESLERLSCTGKSGKVRRNTESVREVFAGKAVDTHRTIAEVDYSRAYTDCPDLTWQHVEAIKALAADEDCRASMSGHGQPFVRNDAPLTFKPGATVILLDGTAQYSAGATRRVLGEDFATVDVRVRAAENTTIIQVVGKMTDEGPLSPIDYGFDADGKLSATAARRIAAIKRVFEPEVTFAMRAAAEQVGASYYRGPEAKGSNVFEKCRSILLLPYHESQARFDLCDADPELAELVQTLHRTRPLRHAGRTIINATQRDGGAFERELPGATVLEISVGVVDFLAWGEVPDGFGQEVVDFVWSRLNARFHAAGTPVTEIAQYKESYWGDSVSTVPPAILLGLRRFIKNWTDEPKGRRPWLGQVKVDNRVIPLPSNWTPNPEQVALMAAELYQSKEVTKMEEEVATIAHEVTMFGEAPPSLTRLAEKLSMTRQRMTRLIERYSGQDASAWVDEVWSEHNAEQGVVIIREKRGEAVFRRHNNWTSTYPLTDFWRRLAARTWANVETVELEPTIDPVTGRHRYTIVVPRARSRGDW